MADTDESLPEFQGTVIASRLNWLRAAVLGANDGIVSTAALIFGVAGAAAEHQMILIAGIAAVAAGAMSMAVGEYVSVSSQRDLENSQLARELKEIEANPSQELDQLTRLLQGRGISRNLARQVAIQLTKRDALTAHARLELNIDPSTVVNPWHAAFASMLSFITGGLIPLLAMLLMPQSIAVLAAGTAVILALALTGTLSARLGQAPILPAVARTVAGGLLAMAATYGLGRLVGSQL
jgi:VIT1/CCC1 family predicted Fe2+/Mn2+ transporter